MAETGQSLCPEPPDSPRVPPPNRPTADDRRRDSGDWAPPPARPRPAPVRPAPLIPATATGKGITFTLRKSTLASLIGGLLLLGVLIFIGGFLSGVRLILSRQSAQMELPASLTTASANTGAPALPSGGSAPTDARAAPAAANTLMGQRQQNATAGTAPEHHSAARSATAPTLSAMVPPSPAPPAASSAPPSQTTPRAAGPKAPPPAAETADNLAIEPPVPLLLQPALKAGDKPTLAPASTTVRVNPLAGPLPPPPPSDRNQRLFTLQVGAFLDKADADRISAELQSRGYAVMILKTVDAGQREWFRVRISQYTTLKQATAAAQAFQEKERIPIEVVRQPAGPLQK